jgi:hypothetical protein
VKLIPQILQMAHAIGLVRVLDPDRLHDCPVQCQVKHSGRGALVILRTGHDSAIAAGYAPVQWGIVWVLQLIVPSKHHAVLVAKIESTRAECSRLRLRDGFTLTQKIVTKAAALRKARRKVTDLEDELDDVTRELNGLELADELDAASLDIGNLAAKTHEAVSGDRNAIDKLMEELVKHKISRVNDYDRRAAEEKKACRMLDEIGTVSGQLDAMKLRVQQLEHRIALGRDASRHKPDLPVTVNSMIDRVIEVLPEQHVRRLGFIRRVNARAPAPPLNHAAEERKRLQYYVYRSNRATNAALTFHAITQFPEDGGYTPAGPTRVGTGVVREEPPEIYKTEAGRSFLKTSFALIPVPAHAPATVPQPVAFGPAKESRYELEQRSKEYLQNKLKEIGQQTSGKKETLVSRLAAATDAPNKPPLWPGVQPLYAHPRDHEETRKRAREQFNRVQQKSDEIAAAMEPSKESFEATRARIKDLPPPVSNARHRSNAEAGHVCSASCECDRNGCKCDVCKSKSRNERTGRCVVRRPAPAMPSIVDLLRDFLLPEGGDDMEEDEA